MKINAEVRIYNSFDKNIDHHQQSIVAIYPVVMENFLDAITISPTHLMVQISWKSI